MLQIVDNVKQIYNGFLIMKMQVKYAFFYYIKSVSESLLCETAGVDRKYRMSKEGENW